MLKSKRLKLKKEEKELLASFWNSCNLEQRTHLMGSFVAIAYISFKKKFIVPNSIKLFKWFQRMLIEQSGKGIKEINLNWIELTKFYFKERYCLEINDNLLPSQQYLDETINKISDGTYDCFINGGNAERLFGTK